MCLKIHYHKTGTTFILNYHVKQSAAAWVESYWHMFLTTVWYTNNRSSHKFRGCFQEYFPNWKIQNKHEGLPDYKQESQSEKMLKFRLVFSNFTLIFAF